MVLVAGIDHVAAAWAQRAHGLPVNLEDNFNAWLRQRFPKRLRPEEHRTEQEPAEERPAEHALSGEQQPPEGPPGPRPGEPGPGEPRPGDECGERQSAQAPGQAPRGNSACADGDTATGNCDCWRERHGREHPDSELGWLRRALSPYGTPARVEHAGPVDPTTLELLACTATIRTALLAPNGALLDLGRTQRLASAAQKTALLARDGGCIIPGCLVPGDACDAHHITWWTRGGPTDLENLALLCGRHHTEVHLEEWEIRMRDGIPWVTPPSWIDPRRRPLRNAAHHLGKHGTGAP
jgi:hypothetical protein